MQTHSSLFNFHPHVHALVLPGLVREGRFHELKGCSAIAVAVRLRAKFLTALKNQEVLDCDEIEGLMSWNHNSGFNVHVGKPIDGADGEAIQRLTRYMSRAALVRRANPLPCRGADRDGGCRKISGRFKELAGT